MKHVNKILMIAIIALLTQTIVAQQARKPAESEAPIKVEIPEFDFDFQDWQTTNVYEIYPHWRHRYAPNVTENTEHLFSLKLPNPVFIHLAPKEHIQYEWVDWREAAQRVFSWTNIDALKRLGERHQLTL